MNQEKSYIEKRFDTMKRQFIFKGSSAGMILRTILLIIIIILGIMFVDWAVNQSYTYISDENLQNYKQEKHSIIYHMRKNNEITAEQFQQMKDSIYTNAKRDFIIERR